MYLNEILTGFYLALTGKGYTVYKQYTTGTDKRICIVNKGVRPTGTEQLQEANLPDIASLQTMKGVVETNLASLTIGTEKATVKQVSILGPVIDPQTPNEAFIILTYEIVVR